MNNIWNKDEASLRERAFSLATSSRDYTDRDLWNAAEKFGREISSKTEMKWIELKEQEPQSEGVYLVFAPSADPKTPLRHAAWWNISKHQFEGLPSIWVKAITHWSSFPSNPDVFL